ncbi:hemolysin type calcium-binding protein [Aliiruegeria haliotis]|uniref:Hemolysin type calcium-binding protein n=1 Tax=Aliiruegeria haliotis TaxID=1280846 RepID=A0A2T0RVM0_9RHOB|nr:Calx-beta domain-containing protein [Aliiruegeria haliotis]PRY25197.1 hemolysin type calcium-binding protein [Aliiruegeria haliotis]
MRFYWKHNDVGARTSAREWLEDWVAGIRWWKVLQTPGNYWEEQGANTSAIALSVASGPLTNIFGTEVAEDLIGTGRDERIYGYGGNDRLYGKGGNDELHGGEGNDVLNGGEDRDTMFGGPGDDSYYVDDPGDMVSETSTPGVDDGGTDTVKSDIGFALGAYVEKLQLTGGAAVDGTGNALNNNIKGNGAANTLTGGDGRDTIYGYGGSDILVGGLDRDYLYGGADSDTFVLRPEPGAWDKVYDLANEDFLGIYGSEFGLSEGSGFIGGVLDPDYFVAGAAATATGHGQFVYRADKAELLWDSDGTGAAKALRITLVQAGATVDSSQIISMDQGGGVSVAAFSSDPQGEDLGSAYFVLTLDKPLDEDVELTFSTVDGSASAADGDFVGLSAESLVLNAGFTTAYVPVTLLNDDESEPVESFSLQIDSANIVGSGAPVAIATAQATMLIKDDAPKVVAEHATAPLGMTDPSGIAYDVRSNRLIIADSEVEEEPFFQDENIFALTLDGDLKASRELKFTTEPTGLAINTEKRLLFTTDDDENMVFASKPHKPNKVKWKFDTTKHGGIDPEDIAVDRDSGNLFIVNGLDRKVIEVNQRGKKLIDSFVLDPEISDPEALAYDHQDEVFYVGGGFSDKIWMLDRDGDIIDVITVLEGARSQDLNRRVNVKDIEIAPASDGSGEKHLYVADYGWSHEADGRLIEIDLGDAGSYWNVVA